MGIYAYRGERGVTIEVSSRLLQSLTRKEKEKLRCFAASILAFMGIACQLASIVGFVVVLLLTGVANVALVPEAERVGNVGLFALPCSFHSPFVDSTCSLYGRPVRAAIQLLLVN